MGKPTGFMDYARETAQVQPPKERIRHFQEFRTPLSLARQQLQGAAWIAACPSVSLVG